MDERRDGPRRLCDDDDDDDEVKPRRKAASFFDHHMHVPCTIRLPLPGEVINAQVMSLCIMGLQATRRIQNKQQNDLKGQTRI